MFPHMKVPREAIVLSVIALLAPFDAGAAGAWTELEPVIVARQEVAAATLGGRLYLIGGIEEGATATIEEYDPVTDRWSLLATLPGILHHTAAVAAGDWIYIIGGYDSLDFRPTASVRRFDPKSATLESLPPLPSPSAAHTAGVIGGVIYVAGGAQSPSRLLSFDLTTRTWTILPSMPTPREHLASAVIGERLFVVGGRLGGVISGALESYEPTLNTWTTHTAMPTPRGGLAAATAFERLYVFGGEGNRASTTGVFAETESYDPATDRWQAEPDMPLPRHGIAASTLGGRIHIPAGAPIEGFSRTTLHDAFDPSPSRRIRPVRRGEQSSAAARREREMIVAFQSSLRTARGALAAPSHAPPDVGAMDGSEPQRRALAGGTTSGCGGAASFRRCSWQRAP